MLKLTLLRKRLILTFIVYSFSLFLIFCNEPKINLPVAESDIDLVNVSEMETNLPVTEPDIDLVNVSKIDVSDTDKSSTAILPTSQIILELLPGTIARYKIREELTRFIDPITAIGETSAISGNILFDAEGNVLSSSLISMDAKTLKSNESKRDNWIVRRGVLGDVINLNITDVAFIEWPLPKLGVHSFTITGDLDIAGVTNTTDWSAEGEFFEDTISGTANTVITWEDFQINKPRFPFIISVDDDIVLEIDFNVTR